MEKTPLQRLRDGDLPKMVPWFSPTLLAKVGLRTVISSVFGQYADQRLFQAATDEADFDTLVSRYDYSDPDTTDPNKRVRRDAEGGLWIDYCADTGDGFESTYAMAFLLSLENLELKGGATLPRGEILIFGGDQAYPEATRQEYERRLIEPFGWTHTTNKNLRKAFAIPGNHDWYDGLAAFDALFCAARDKLSASNQSQIVGGWELRQHRSYWALKMPYNWWIWGADIQFSKYLDNAQVNYFETMARQMSHGDNLLICISEPAWLLAEETGMDEEENLFKLATIARRQGVNVRAVVAGDYHHYARYDAPELGTQFFTAGGGGAFMHATHKLKNSISVTWPQDEEEAEPTVQEKVAAPGKGLGAKGEHWKAHKVDINLKRNKLGHYTQAHGVPAADGVSPAPADPMHVPPGATKPKPRTSGRAPKCYPAKGTSMLLSLRNLAFPLFNPGFSIAIGILYWLVTWQFHATTKEYNISGGAIDNVSLASYWGVWKLLPLYGIQASFAGAGFTILFFGLAIVLFSYVNSVKKPAYRKWLVTAVVGALHFIAHAVAMFSIFLLLMVFNNWLAPQLSKQIERQLKDSQHQESVVDTVVKESLGPLSQQSYEQRRISEQSQIDAKSSASRVPDDLPPLRPLMETTTKVEQTAVRKVVGLLYPFQMALFGGFIGGLIWGAYWVFTGLIGRMHTEDAFGALSIKNYKNFLRMRFGSDALTIYPIGLNRVPGRNGWAGLPAGNTTYENRPRLIPTPPLRPELIEEAIIIPNIASAPDVVMRQQSAPQ